MHGEVPLRADVSFAQLQDALKPLWKYAGAKSLADGAHSAYEEEPGIKFDAHQHLLQICWTVPGDEDFRQSLDEMCMSLNELAEQGAAIEVTFYDTDFDEDEEEQTAVNAAPAAAISETDRAAIRTDLQPLVNAVATLVQNKGGTPPELNWDAITDAVFLNRSLEGELMGQMGEAFLLGLGIGPDELAQVLKEATADNS